MLAIVLLGAACAAPPPWQQDAYVWQRQWTPAVASAMVNAAPFLGGWRVLAEQIDASGNAVAVNIDAKAIRASGRSVTLVMRLDGRMPDWNEDALLARVALLRQRWSALPITGIEIDHDAGTARLPEYAHFLQRLHEQCKGVRLSITVLPAWLASPALSDVLAAVDEPVLQVHAVQSPREGLFDVDRARAWIETMSALSAKPFRVALPTYGSRVSWDDRGQVLAVESESSALAGGAPADELSATPTDVSRLLASLQRHRPAHLAGVVWFRLPLAGDRRAWSMPTFRAVALGLPLDATVIANLRPADSGASDIVLHNDGAIDADLPSSIGVPLGCTADGANGYAMASNGKAGFLQRTQPGWLRAHSQRTIGWARCAHDKVVFNVQR